MNSKYTCPYDGNGAGTVECKSTMDLSLALQKVLKDHLGETGSFIESRSLTIEIKSNVKFKNTNEKTIQELRKKIEELTRDIENIIYGEMI